MNGVQISSARDALYIASEMEKRAVKLYERAAMLWPDNEMTPAIEGMLADEKQHLKHFTALMGDTVPAQADALLLSAYAGGILFEGGLHAAARQGAFNSPEALIRYAAAQEQIAVDSYTRFAAQCDHAPAAQSAFLQIAQEESLHLTALHRALAT
ncbi:MAG: ferritin-like domain-containing protein [Clostridia bacterium]|nr:ferritin-like domain-containing protein [Clostridia bacterium]